MHVKASISGISCKHKRKSIEISNAEAIRISLSTAGIRNPFKYRDIVAAVTPDKAESSAAFTLRSFMQKDRRSENLLMFISTTGQYRFYSGKATIESEG